MKKSLSFILAVTMILSVIVPASLFASAAETVLLNFDSTTGFAAHYGATYAVESSNKTEGSGSVKFGFTQPTADAGKIGGMLHYEYPSAQDFSSYKTLSIDVYLPVKASGSSALQVNFITETGTNWDGFNVMLALDGRDAGWHTFSITRVSQPPAISSAKWTSISRLRFTWFNYSGDTTTTYFLLDNLRGVSAGGSSSSSTPSSDSSSTTSTPSNPNEAAAPYKSGNDLIINDGESTNGWKTEFNATISASSNCTEGSSAVSIASTIPKGQNANIGAMAFLNIPTTDLSGYKYFALDLHISETVAGGNQFQVNFCSSDSADDGINYIIGIGDKPAGWHTFLVKLSDTSAVVAGNSWDNITRIRMTWFNLAQVDTKAIFTVDNFRLTNGHTAQKVGNDLVLHNFDNLMGLKSEFNTSLETKVSSTVTYVKEGTGSLKLTPTIPVGQSARVGAMFFINFDQSVDLTNYDYITLYFRCGSDLTGQHGLQINCNTGTSQDGFNYTYALDDSNSSWHTIKIAKDKFEKADNNAKWDKIDNIRITWFNTAQYAYADAFYIDCIKACVEGEVSSEPEPSVVEPSSEPSSEPEPSEEPSSEPSSEDESSAVAPDFTYGDIDENGDITSADALLALQYSVQKVQFTERQKMIADVAKPLSVNSSDALAILQYSVKKITEFDPPARPVTPESSEAVSSEIVPDTSSETPPVSSTTSTPDFDIPDSVINNGAYAKDTTADLSFSITTEGLQPKTVYLVTSAIPDTSTDHARLVYSLQGLINRDFGLTHNTLIYMNGVDASDLTWYQKMTAAGAAFEGYGRKVIRTFDDFYTAFEPQIKQCGYILWDPNVPATSNVAGTICGLDGYLPVRSGSALQTYLNGKGVSQKKSLVGQFNGSVTGSPKNDAYRWALTNYFSRCSATYLGYTLDGAPTLEGSPYTHNYVSLPNHDYLIARRAFMFDLDPYNGEVACDAGGGKKGLDNETMLMIFQERYNRANGEFGQLLGYTPWWCKYASDGDVGYPNNNGNHGAKQAVFLEWLLCEYLGCYNIAKEADAAHPCEMSNGSAFYKYPITQKITNNHTAQTTSFNANTYYFTIYVGDYDSSAWLKKYTAQYWIGDSARGTLPLMWAFNPNLVYRSPVLFDFINKNKTSNDYIVAGEGAGYIIPHGVFQGKRMSYSGVSRPAGNGDGSQKWADYNKYFYKLCDMDITGFLLNGANGIDGDIFNCYNQFNTVGSFHMDSGLPFVKRNEVPYIALNIGCPDSAGMYSYATGTMGSYRFSCFRTVSESPTQIKERVNGLISYGAGRGVSFQYVDPYSFFNLAKQSGRLSAR